MKIGDENQTIKFRGRKRPPTREPRPRGGPVRKSRTAPWRAGALILLNLFMVAHLIQWRITGRTVS
ncbi:MAG: hypothetical protein ACREFG_10280, partial [Chthoniobacterales bacterium]